MFEHGTDLRDSGAEPATGRDLLAKAGVQSDGGHLYYRALANLIRRDRDCRKDAAALFRQVTQDYASSSLARYTDSFARQLSSPNVSPSGMT